MVLFRLLTGMKFPVDWYKSFFVLKNFFFQLIRGRTCYVMKPLQGPNYLLERGWSYFSIYHSTSNLHANFQNFFQICSQFVIVYSTTVCMCFYWTLSGGIWPLFHGGGEGVRKIALGLFSLNTMHALPLHEVIKSSIFLIFLKIFSEK